MMEQLYSPPFHCVLLQGILLHQGEGLLTLRCTMWVLFLV